MLIENSHALIAGGASGLGAATVRRLHQRGASVTIVDADSDRGRRLADELSERVQFQQCDITSDKQLDQVIERSTERFGAARIAVCCAGIGWAEKITGKSGPHSLEAFQKVINVNLVGTFNFLRLVTTQMLKAEVIDEERGVCITTASIAAFDGQIGHAAYAASKAGIAGFTLPVARELARHAIRIVAIAPGLFDTPLLAALPEDARVALGSQVPHPHRLGRPEEYGALAEHVVENPMINGEVIRLDGALRMPPQ